MAEAYWRRVCTNHESFGGREVWSATFERDTPRGLVVRTLTLAVGHDGAYHTSEAMVFVPVEGASGGPYR